MGGKNSKPVDGEQVAKSAAKAQLDYDWPQPPETPPESEQDGAELVLQAWASCKAKPSPATMYRSDVEEKERRGRLAWRKRASFVELDCGDDSFFVSNTYKVIGVADGVGGWREQGVDPSVFANTLMRNAKWYSESHREDLDPERIVTAAFEKTKHDGEVSAGSSTACCAALRKEDPPADAPAGAEPTYRVDVANLGDSGGIVIRDQEIVHRFHEKTHGFNCPFQLSILPKDFVGRCYADSMRSALRESVPVRDGDVVVLATDGLFDNRFCSAVAREAGWVGDVSRTPYDGIPVIGSMLKWVAGPSQRVEYTDPYRVVQRVVQDAYKASTSKEGNTPWAAALRDFGVESAKGGKVDDITVVVARVMRRDEARRTTLW